MTCSEWSLSRLLWKKVCQLEKSTPAVLVALVTNYSYDLMVNIPVNMIWLTLGYQKAYQDNLVNKYQNTDTNTDKNT